MSSLEIDDRRQRLLINHPEDISALIIGAGSIGSVAAMLLARTGIGSIDLYDDDILEEWNSTGGLFDRGYMGEPKVLSVHSLILSATGRDIEIWDEKFDYDTPIDEPYDIVIVGVDSLSARRQIWDRLEIENSWRLLIDGRMGGHVCEVLTLDKNDRDKYEWYQETLGVTIAPMPCGTEATAYVMSRLTSMIGRSVRYMTNREAFVPFRQYWDAENDSEFVSRPPLAA